MRLVCRAAIASVTRITRKPQSTAPSTVASTQTSVSPPVTTTVSMPASQAAHEVAPRPRRVDVLVEGAGGRNEAGELRHQVDHIRHRARRWSSNSSVHIPPPHAGALAWALAGMKRVKIVRSGWAAAIATAFGRTRVNQGIVQSVFSTNIRCMSTEQWTASGERRTGARHSFDIAPILETSSNGPARGSGSSLLPSRHLKVAEFTREDNTGKR